MEIKLNNGKSLLYEVTNSTTIKCNSSNYFIEEKCNDTGINSISFDNNYTISIGDSLPVVLKNGNNKFSTKYNVNKIVKKKESYLFKEFEYSDNNYFLIPSIGIRSSLVYVNESNIFHPYFINSYTTIDNKDWESKEDLVYLVYRFTPFEGFTQLDKLLKAESSYVDKIKDGDFNIYAYKILSQYKNDVITYCSNNLDLSNSYKKRIKLFYNLNENDFNYKLLFNKELLRQEMSKSFGYNIPKEMLLHNKISKQSLIWKSPK